ncbi:hypothetical protein OAF61_02145 [Pseudomonadales bacterium]|nr:hypothetical protein [Pseudomonadales bacterium]
MRDVFKYFKHVRSLQESKGAEKAAELGYQHQARGVYLDPKTQRKYKNIGDKLEPIIDEPSAEKGGGAAATERPQKKSLGQFTQDATGGAEQSAKRGDIDPNNVEGGIPDQKKVEILAKGMSGGRWDQLDAARRKLLMQAATEKLAQIQMQQAAAVEPEPEPEPQPEPVEEPAKKPEDFSTLDDKVAEKKKKEEDDMTGGALDDLLGAIQSGDEKKEKETIAKLKKKQAPKKPKVEKREIASETIDRTNNLIGDITSEFVGGKQVKASKDILARLQDTDSSERIDDYFNTYFDEKQRIKDTWDDISTIDDEDSAIRYLTEGLGYTLKDNGRIGPPAEYNRERRAMGGAGMPGEGRGESRAVDFEEIQSLNDPEWSEILMTAEEDGGRRLQAATIKNDVSWETATNIYNRLTPDLQRKLDGWGKPEAAQGTFTPLGPVEFMKDSEGNFTGETNIDVLARTDPEEYAKHFSRDNAGNPGRGKFLLQKLLATGGRGQYSNLPTFFDFDTITPDHVIGRSSGDIGNGRFKDDPLNLVLDRRGLNQFKVSSQADGERDTIKTLVKAAGKVKGATGSGMKTIEGTGDELDSNPDFQTWAAYRMAQSDFDPKMIAKRKGEGGLTAYPETNEEIYNLDSEGLKQLISKNAKNNPLGLNMRNMSMLAPRADKRPLTTNTWGGAPGGGVEYNPLPGYRKAVLASALQHPDVKSEIEAFDKTLENKKWSDEKKQAARDKFRRDVVGFNYFEPQKAASSLYGLGYINNQQYTDRLKEFATSKLEFMKETDPETHKKFIKDLDAEMKTYKEKLDKTMPNGPYQFPSDELAKNLKQPYIRAAMSSNYGRSMMPPELVAAFDGVADNKKFISKLSEGLTKSDGRVMMERLKKSLRDPLNGKTFI